MHSKLSFKVLTSIQVADQDTVKCGLLLYNQSEESPDFGPIN